MTVDWSRMGSKPQKVKSRENRHGTAHTVFTNLLWYSQFTSPTVGPTSYRAKSQSDFATINQKILTCFHWLC